MAQLPVVTPDGKSKSVLEAADAVFAAPIKVHLIRVTVNALLANRRSGTASTRTRGMVSGGGRKPFRQKGTGRARQGTNRAAQMRGGSIIFGPQPRSYRKQVNRKIRRQAVISALSALQSENAIRVVEDFGINAPKTKDMAALLSRLGLDGGKTIILLAEPNPNVALSARNIPYASVISAEELNVFDLVTHDHLLTTPDAIQVLEAKFSASEEVKS